MLLSSVTSATYSHFRFISFDSENNYVRSEKFNFGCNLFQDFGKSSFFKLMGDADLVKVNDSFVQTSGAHKKQQDNVYVAFPFEDSICLQHLR